MFVKKIIQFLMKYFHIPIIASITNRIIIGMSFPNLDILASYKKQTDGDDCQDGLCVQVDFHGVPHFIYVVWNDG